MPSQRSPAPVSNDSALGCFIRLYWLALGNAVLALSALKIAMSESGGALSVLDFVFGAGVFSLIVLRFVDIQHFNGQDSNGKPATLADWRRYALTLGAVSVALLTAAHGIAFLLNKQN